MRTGSKIVLLVLAMIVTTCGLSSDVFAQANPRIAVTAFENKVKSPWWDRSWQIGEGLAEMLTSELVKTGRFIVVERQAVGDIVKEQELGQTGLVRRESAAPTGQMLGAQIVVRGAITEFEARASGGGAGVRWRDLGIEGKAENAHVGLDLRLIDTSSGQVMASHNVSKVVPAAGGALGARAGTVTFGGDVFYQTPIGQATRAAIQEALRFILATAVRPGAPSISIVKVDGRLAYINAGANANVRVGSVFVVFSAGEDLVDPDTGLKLGTTERPIGTIQITEVQEKFSVGTIQGGTGVMKRGDRIKFQ